MNQSMTNHNLISSITAPHTRYILTDCALKCHSSPNHEVARDRTRDPLCRYTANLHPSSVDHSSLHIWNLELELKGKLKSIY